MISTEYTFLNEHLSTNVHIAQYDSDYDFMGGIGIAYRFQGLTGPYAFHSSEWINGTINQISTRYVDNQFVGFNEDEKDINYWRLILGLGYQHMFFKHFGMYFEMGFEFYAGNGRYYINFDQKDGCLNNDELNFPAGLGLSVEF